MEKLENDLYDRKKDWESIIETERNRFILIQKVCSFNVNIYKILLSRRNKIIQLSKHGMSWLLGITKIHLYLLVFL